MNCGKTEIKRELKELSFILLLGRAISEELYKVNEVKQRKEEEFGMQED